MEAQTDLKGKELRGVMEQTKEVLNNRVNAMGISESTVVIEGKNRLRVEMPGVKDAEAAITATVEAIAEALTREEKVQLVGFGSFEVKTRAARVGRNPKTGTEIEIPQTKTPVFKAGKALKDAVAG